MIGKLTRRRLEWLVRARGTDLSTWPRSEREAALALMRRSPEARAVLVDALVAEEAPEAELPVLERMQAALRRSLAPLPLIWRGLGAGALLACVAAGLYLASTQDLPPNPVNPDNTIDPFATVQTVSFASLDQ